MRTSTTSSLALFLVLSSVSVSVSVSALDFDNGSLRRAVTEYLEDSAAATAEYGPMNDWSTWKVTDTSRLFQGATDFDGDIADWDMSSVTTMHHMFAGASSYTGTSSLSSPSSSSIGDWNVGSVVDFSYMMADTQAFDGRTIGRWDTSQALTMEQMFLRATAFVGPETLQDWDVSDVTNMFAMFYGATAFNRPVDHWKVDNVVRMNSLFEGASSFSQEICWDTMSPAARCFQCFCGAAPAASFSQNGGSCKSRIHPSVVAYSEACSKNDAFEVELESLVFERPEDPLGGFLVDPYTTDSTSAGSGSSYGFDSPAGGDRNDSGGGGIAINPTSGSGGGAAPAAVQREASGALSTQSSWLVGGSLAVVVTFLLGFL